MDSKQKKTVLWSVIAVVVLAAVAVAVWLIVSPGSAKPTGSGGVEEITYQTPTTMLHTESGSFITRPPETTTLSEEESYVEQFLAEANTYSQTVEATTTPPGSRVFFHVVTDGMVSDDNSLEGLTGAAKTIGETILAAGFRYDKNQQLFYSDSQSWQRNWGFTPLYDASAALIGMYYDTMRLKFTYGDHDWMFQLWKGRYGITTGGEIGIYYKPKGSDSSLYDAVPDSETITMSFALYRGDDLYMTRGPEAHWWLTGFKLFDMVAPQDLTMHATFFMANAEMADKLEESLIDLGFIKNVNYQRLGLTMTIIWN